ncbi:MAG: ATP-binding protein [Bacteroidetes bacterium]|nr:ATP-binding protein [Bacteroidota bacterium]
MKISHRSRVSDGPNPAFNRKDISGAAQLNDLRKLVNAGESQYLEFKAKANFPEKIARSICAFANAEGGTLLLGVGDDGKLLGIKDADEDLQVIARLLNQTRPRFKWKFKNILLSSTRSIVVFEVRESNKKPVGLKIDRGLVYYRSGDSNVQAGLVMAEVLRRKSSSMGSLITFGADDHKLMAYFSDGKPHTFNSLSNQLKLDRPVLVDKLAGLVVSGVLRVLPGAPEETLVLNLI